MKTKITDLIPKRYSCRTYQNKPLDETIRAQISEFLTNLGTGPFGNVTRFELVAGAEGDSKDLRGLGTYGFIKKPAGFIVGAIPPGEKNLEDFGYQMEKSILYASDLGLGTCWLGGTFTKSKFAKKINLQENEVIPAVTATGYIQKKTRRFDREIRRIANSDHRYAWDWLFFDSEYGKPLLPKSAGSYEIPLQMVRLAPSASNRQPWRIIKKENGWHFYLKRTPGYLTNNYAKFLQLEDLQRVDMGIAMCHFDLAAKELGLSGQWISADPDIYLEMQGIEYVVSWV